MKDLKNVLRDYAPKVNLGGGEAKTQLKPEILKVDLQRLRKSKDWAFIICAGMVVLAFIISIALVIALLILFAF